VTESWAREAQVRTVEDAAELMRMQMPFHFASVRSEGYRRYLQAEDRAIYSPEILAYTASHEYHIEYEAMLGSIKTDVDPGGRARSHHHASRRSRDARGHCRQPAGDRSRAGHQSYIEQPDVYFAAVRDFLAQR
jgi:hypothetical protein